MSSPSTTTILMFSANPKGTSRLRLDEEKREIKLGLERSQQRDRFTFISAEAVRAKDFRRAMLEYSPEIVHFSGHGGENQGLAFEDESGRARFIEAEALAGLFALFADSLRCVVLNACYSEVQAEAIAHHIPYVIGMNEAIGDQAAIEFAVGFYDALGAGRDFQFAHKFGCEAIRLSGIPGHLIPVLKQGLDLEDSPEESLSIFKTPQLQTLHSVAESTSIISPAEPLNRFKPEPKRWNGLLIAGLGGTALLTLAITGLPQIRQQLGLSKPPCLFEHAVKEKKWIVAIAALQGSKDKDKFPDIEKHFFDRLTTRLPQDVTTCLAATANVSSNDEARTLGEQLGAKLVLWGRFNSLGLEIYVTPVDAATPSVNALTLSKTDAEDFEVQIKTLPQVVYVMTAVELSQSYQDQNKELEARKVLQDALNLVESKELSLNNANFTERLARAYFKLGQLYNPAKIEWDCSTTRQDCLNALNAYKTAASMDKGNQQAWIEQGILLERLQNPSEAKKAYSQVIQSAPESAQGLDARGYRANIELDLGQTESAIADLKFICQHYLNSYAWFSQLGQAQLKAGQVQEAENTYLRVKKYLGNNKTEKSRIIEELRTFAQKNLQDRAASQRIIENLSH